jgi:hypothetical protein
MEISDVWNAAAARAVAEANEIHRMWLAATRPT